MPTGVYERKTTTCRTQSCERRISATYSKSGLCRPCATRAWKKANSTKVNAHNRKYNRAKPDVMRAARARWESANPDYRTDYASLRRARKSANFVEKVYRSKVYRRDDGICGICESPVNPSDFHIDHIMPLALGGEHSYQNVQLAHPVCNLAKGARVAS